MEVGGPSCSTFLTPQHVYMFSEQLPLEAIKQRRVLSHARASASPAMLLSSHDAHRTWLPKPTVLVCLGPRGNSPFCSQPDSNFQLVPGTNLLNPKSPLRKLTCHVCNYSELSCDLKPENSLTWTPEVRIKYWRNRGPLALIIYILLGPGTTCRSSTLKVDVWEPQGSDIS